MSGDDALLTLLDAQQWLLDLIAQDVGRLVTGLIGVLIVLELIVRFREWLRS